jgi:hypothetical protein
MTGTFTNYIDTANFDVSNAGTVTLASGQSYTGSGAVTLSSGSATNLSLLAGLASDIQVVQVGAGGAGSTTPDYFALDVKSTTGDPPGVDAEPAEDLVHLKSLA